MGLFSFNYNKPGPGVAKDAPKKKGVLRYFEMFARDFGTLWKTGMMLFVCAIPTVAAAVFTALSAQYLLLVFAGVAAIALSGLLLGPALCACHAVIIKIVRDEPGFFWHDFKKAWRSCWRQSMGPSALFSALLALDVYTLYLSFQMGKPNAIVLGCIFLSLLIIVGAWLFFCFQIVFMTIPFAGMLKNSLLLLFGRIQRSMPATLVILLCAAALVLLVPIPFWILVPLLGVPAWIMLWADMLVWPVVDEVFRIDEQQKAREERRRAEEAAPHTD